MLVEQLGDGAGPAVGDAIVREVERDKVLVVQQVGNERAAALVVNKARWGRLWLCY